MIRIVYLPAILAAIATAILAQTPPPARPRVGDLKEEQRLIDKAYLGDADFLIKRALERLGGGNNRLAQQSGLWALEQIAYAKRRLERHASKIEEAGGLFFERATESTRKELRESYTQVRESYHNTEERLESLAQRLQKAGLPILAETLQNVRSSSGEGAIRAVNDGLRRAGEQGQGDKVGGETVKEGTQGGSGGGMAELTSSSGTRFAQTADGVMVIPPGTLIRGARLGSNNTIIFANGSSASIESIKAGPNGSLTFTDPASGQTSTINPTTGLPQAAGGNGSGPFSGQTPNGVTVVDQNGRRITVGPDWKNGEQIGISKEYLDMSGGILESETKVTRRLTETTGSVWKAQEVPGERRTWNFSIRVGEEKKASGSISFLLTVDGGGQTGFTIKTWEVADTAGTRASVTPITGKPAATASFAKGGKYESFVTGETDWGSPFRIKGPVIDAYP